MGPRSFFEDIILFPLGLTASKTPAASQTIGKALLGSGGAQQHCCSREALVAAASVTALLFLLRIVALGPNQTTQTPGRGGGGARNGGGDRHAVIEFASPTGRSGYFDLPGLDPGGLGLAAARVRSCRWSAPPHTWLAAPAAPRPSPPRPDAASVTGISDAGS